jgi:hypothetical protein
LHRPLLVLAASINSSLKLVVRNSNSSNKRGLLCWCLF